MDKRSFIRWKQEAIHRDRRDRKDKIAALEMEKASNAALLKEMESFVGKRDGTEASLAALATKYGQLQEKQKEDIFRMRFTDRDERWGPPVPDEFVEGRIDYKATLESAASDTSKLESAIAMIKKRQAKIVETIAKEMDEQNKKITSENWGKVGFDKTVGIWQASLVLCNLTFFLVHRLLMITSPRRMSKKPR